MIKVRGLRRHIVAQVVVCLLLSWAAADLLVPQLCNVEQAQQSDSPRAPQDLLGHNCIALRLTGKPTRI